MELDILRWIQQFSSEGLDFLFIAITQLGEENVFVALVTLIYWNVDKRFGKVLGMALMVTLVVNNSLKEFFDVARPIGEEGIRSLRVETATGKSFPSGHTQSSSSFYTILAIYSKKRWVQVICGSVIFMIGMSRLYLGVHYPKDVIVAWVLGVGIASGIYIVMTKKNQNRAIYIGAIIVGSILLPFSLSEDYFKSFGLLLGFVLAVMIEEKHVGFSTDISIGKKMIRFILGIVLVLAIKVGLKVILPHSMIADMIRYFMVGIVAIGLYPMLFKKLNV